MNKAVYQFLFVKQITHISKFPYFIQSYKPKITDDNDGCDERVK